MNTETSNPTDLSQELDKAEKPALNLSVEIKPVSACQRHVIVTIPRDDIELYFQKQFDELQPKAEVPGFRVGRAPRKLLESKFRKQVADQVKGSLLMDSLAQINERHDISAISEPDLDFEQINIPDEGDLTYEFDIEVRPEFALPQWKGLVLERPEHEFSDNEIDKQLKKLLVQHSDMVPVDEPIQAGDFVVCNLTSRFEGRTIASEGELAIQVLPTLSLSDATIEGFEKLMNGARANDKRSATVEISQFADQEEFQGKTVDLEFEVLDVKRVEAISAEKLAEKFAIPSAEELRQVVRNSLEERLKYAQRERIRDQISKTLTEAADWELPPDLLRRQSRRELERAVIEMRSSGFSEQEITVRENGLRKNILEKTALLLKEHFILERIAEEEKIQDDPSDYDLEIARIALQRNDSPRRVRARLERTGQIDVLRNMIVERKVIELITEHAKFKSNLYEIGKKETTSAVNFFAAGRSGLGIPQAKYDDNQAEPLPGVKERD